MNDVKADAKAIFLEALDYQGSDELMRFLEQACGADAALRTRVEELLRAHRNAGAFLGGADKQDVTRDDPIAERPGTLIGPYKLMEQIGEGGMGLVFVGEQQHPVRRKVAVKVIKPGMDTREVIARFEAERQALALMDHPNIARVFDAGATQSGRPYFVMELVRGVGITQFCDENRLTLRERLELFVHVCQAVQHAHQKGIIHRDLKAANILVTLHDGTPVVKVIDFGVAKAIGQQLTDKTIYTRFAQMIGTPMYMSPEQAEMSGLDIDTRSDIYALGVLLYELLTGATPFDKERLRTATYDEIRRIVREEEPPRPSQRISTLLAATLTIVSAQRNTEPARLSQVFRGELDWIVMKALEKDRNRRYETASAFAADVQRYLHDEPVQACPPTLRYRLRKTVRRHRSAVLVVSLVVLALVGGIIGTTLGMIRATYAEADAVEEAGQKEIALKDKESALKDKEAALSAAQQSERDAKKGLWLSLYEQARARRFSRQMGQRLDSLDALANAAAIRPDERLRDEAIAAMALPDVRLGPSWQARSGHFVAFDARYRLYARASGEGAISIRSVADNREIHGFVAAAATGSGLSLSPDGRYLTTLDNQSSLRVWRVADGEEVVRQKLQTSAWAFSQDSRQLVVGQQGWILRFDLATGQELNRWQLPENMQAYSLAFNPDNSKLAIGYANANVASVYDAASGILVTDLPVGPMTESAIAWDADGRRLAVTGSLDDPVIQIWDVAAKRKLAILVGHVQRVTRLTFHPNGDLLATASWDGTVRLWDPATAQQLMQLPIAVAIQFSGDGRWLGVTLHGEQAQLLEVTATREYRALVSSLGAGKGGYNLDSDISPDGQLLAQSMNDAVRLWHLASGRELAVLPPGRPLFNSNGELLIAGPGALHRWPIQPGAAANELRLGPPKTIALPAVPIRAERSLDGRSLAIVSESGGMGLFVDLATNSVRAPRLAHPKAAFVALSPDGRWMASSGWLSDRVRLWNAETGKMVHEWVQYGAAMVFFTPDSRELIVSRWDEFAFHDVETLKPISSIRRDVAIYPGHVAFSPDGKLMALEMAPGVIHLKDVATAKTVAKLEDPRGDRAGWMSFNLDGTQLVVTAPYARAVHIWDLRAIRQRLKGMGLDWEWPEFPPADPKAKAAEPPKVEVLFGDLAKPAVMSEQSAREAIALDPKSPSGHINLGNALFGQKKFDDAIVCYRKAIELNPKSAVAHNNLGLALRLQGKLDDAIAAYREALVHNPKYAAAQNGLGGLLNNAAWRLATHADPTARNPARAVELAKEAVGLVPSGIHWNTLGAAHYRAGDRKAALTALHKSMELGNGGNSFDWFFLAMAHWQLGDKDQACKWHDQAVLWMDKNQPENEELRRFRAEAEETFEEKLR